MNDATTEKSVLQPLTSFLPLTMMQQRMDAKRQRVGVANVSTETACVATTSEEIVATPGGLKIVMVVPYIVVSSRMFSYKLQNLIYS